MKFMCGRPGCEFESVATLAIDAREGKVVLSDPEVSREGVPLCVKHAESTTAPVGWELIDNRDPQMLDKKDTDEIIDTEAGVVKRPGRRRDVESPISEKVSKFPWQHKFEEDKTPDDLVADSPLLSRAFRSSKGSK